VGRLRDDREVALDAPAEQHLRRCAAEALRDPSDGVVGQKAAGAEWAVRVEHDVVLLACVEERLAIGVRVELHLVYRGRDVRSREHLRQLGRIEVGDADRSRIAALSSLLHPRPRPRRPALRPMDDVQIDVVDAEELQAPLDRRDRIPVPGIELRGDEHLVTRDAAGAQALADALFVAVCLRRVDVPIAELERPANGVHARAAVRDLPHAESEQRNRVAVGEWTRLGVLLRSVHEPLQG
jgi:hypothetical protein